MSTSSLTMIQAIEALNWSETKETYTKKGIYRVKSLSPVPSVFWNFWKSAQEILEKQGYAMRKHDGIWYALRFYELARPETMQRLVEESRGVDTDARLLVPPGLAYRPFQRQGIKYCIDRLFGQNGMSERDGVLIADQPGLGKLCDVNTPTLTPTGWRKLGELAVGDQVINADGCASTVTGVFPQGVKAIYKIKFSDGTETNSGLEHLWEVRDSNMKTRGRGWSVRTLGEIMRRGVLGKDGKGKWEIPQFPGHMETHGEAPKIDGWLLGQLIGNGSTGGGDGSVQVSSNIEDMDVIARLESLGGKTRFTTCAQTAFSIERCGRLMDELRKLNLNCKSKEKSIHESLLVTPWEYRVKLLQGLMDSDGSNRRNRIAFHTCSRNLAESVAQLVRSLGGCAIVREYGRAPEGKPTEWSVNVRTPFCPFWSQRKSKGWKADPRNRGNKIVAVTYSHDAEAVCIMVDHQRHLYVTENYKLTHNTIQFLGIINQDPNMLQTKSLIVCPATLKLNWRNEARRWLLDGFGYSAVVTKNRWPGDLEGASIVITNYDVLHKFAKEIRSTRWDYVCFDEAHYLKNENARRTIFALGGAAKMAEQHMVVSSIPAKKTIFLTGTPVENGKAGELINIIEKCDPNGLGANRGKFIDRYQRTDEYLEELQTQMRMRFMVRRLKHEVLKELPPKVRQVIPIDPDECGKEAVIFGEEMRLFKEYQECLKEWAVKTELAKAEGVSYYREVLKAKKASIGMTAGQLARLRKRTALAKVDGVIAQVREIVSDGDPLILFAHHIEVLDRLAEALKKAKISVVRVDGSTPLPMRQKAVEDFQAGKFTVFLGGLKPCGVGITLTKASKVAFVELDWLPGQMEQAEDRCIAEGQLVMTPNGWKKIEEIKIGDIIIGGDGEPAKVLDAWSKGSTKIMSEIIVEGWNEPIITTEDHRIMTKERGWQEAKEIKPGDHLAMPKAVKEKDDVIEIEFEESCRIKKEFMGSLGWQRNGRATFAPEKIKVTDDLLFVAGYFIGDGFASTKSDKGKFVSFSGHREKKSTALKRCQKWAEEQGMSTSRTEQKDSLGDEVRCYSAEWAKWFELQFGKTAHEKKVPKWAQNLNERQSAILLDGLSSSDGYRRGERIEYVTVSKNLAAQVAMVAIRAGMRPCINFAEKAKTWVVAYGTKKQNQFALVRESKLRFPKKKNGARERIFDLTIERCESFVIGTTVVHNCHRIGQEETVMVFHLVIEGSLDEYMAKRLIEKQEKIGRTLDSQYQYDEDDEDDMDEDDKRDSFAAPDRAASKGITAERLEEEAGQMPEAMLNAAGQAIHFLVEEKLERLNGTDRAIATAIVEGAFDKKRLALARKIAMRYASLLDTDLVDKLKWPKTSTELQGTDVH